MKLATLVLFNHRFDRNLPVLDELLKDKFLRHSCKYPWLIFVV